MAKAVQAEMAAKAADKVRAIFRVVIDGSQQAIWDELTRTDRPLPAIFNAHMHTTGLKRGGRMQMRTVSGRNVVVYGEILEYDPPRRFVHTHRFAQHDDPVCIVSYDLKPVTGGIEVTLTVDDMPAGTVTAKKMSGGGHFILNNLKAIVETGRPAFWVRAVYALFGRMEFVFPKRCRTENWPLGSDPHSNVKQ